MSLHACAYLVKTLDSFDKHEPKRPQKEELAPSDQPQNSERPQHRRVLRGCSDGLSYQRGRREQLNQEVEVVLWMLEILRQRPVTQYLGMRIECNISTRRDYLHKQVGMLLSVLEGFLKRPITPNLSMRGKHCISADDVNKRTGIVPRTFGGFQ